MAQNDLMIAGLQQTTDLLKSALADFSDADMMVRPVPGANHAAWQLGHLAHFEATVAGVLAPGKAPAQPEWFGERHGSKGAKIDDPSQFLTKAEMLDIIEKSRAVQAEALRAMSAGDLETPSPEGWRKFAPTVGHLVMMAPVHAAMHLGQFQVIRRKLGKPNIF